MIASSHEIASNKRFSFEDNIILKDFYVIAYQKWQEYDHLGIYLTFFIAI